MACQRWQIYFFKADEHSSWAIKNYHKERLGFCPWLLEGNLYLGMSCRWESLCLPGGFEIVQQYYLFMGALPSTVKVLTLPDSPEELETKGQPCRQYVIKPK